MPVSGPALLLGALGPALALELIVVPLADRLPSLRRGARQLLLSTTADNRAHPPDQVRPGSGALGGLLSAMSGQLRVQPAGCTHGSSPGGAGGDAPGRCTRLLGTLGVGRGILHGLGAEPPGSLAEARGLHGLSDLRPGGPLGERDLHRTLNRAAGMGLLRLGLLLPGRFRLRHIR
ncbi:hypothetical protein [Paenarthrobacter sp. TA1.8]|uniref:hypothetical protein n=1 Tax=Paenarthrobacter sp. TA1.8 TaxID=3400219 RepID=UPI003B428E0E